MSDFIFSSHRRQQGELKKYLTAIYKADLPEVQEYHGEWGSLGVSRSLYTGFQPLESDSHLFLVIGGPILKFADNRHLTGDDPTAGTRRIRDRWLSGSMQWDVDVSGPFVILSIDKVHRTVTCITDLMLFIPVYRYLDNHRILLGTHVDALASAAGPELDADQVSIADFLMHHAVTWPFTFYDHIHQLHPASKHTFTVGSGPAKEMDLQEYWLPEQSDKYGNVKEAALALRNGVQQEVAQITDGMDKVAQFISGGTDSRVIAGLLPDRLQREGFIFLDEMNREGRIAQKAAKAYNLNFLPEFRGKTHYLDILPEACDLIGSGQQHIHAHALVFNRRCNLNQYQAVFGGYSADVFLKNYYSGSSRNEWKSPYASRRGSLKNATRGADIQHYIPDHVKEMVKDRRMAHLEKVRHVRNESALEWARLWPASNRPALPNLGANRRLFRSYELFLCSAVAKISAEVPPAWKEHHMLYHQAFHPFLKKSKWLIHNDGHLPYFSNRINRLPTWCASVWRLRKKLRKRGSEIVHQGPWCNWKTVRLTPEWESWLQICRQEEIKSQKLFTVPAGDIAGNSDMYLKQVVNLFQVMYFFSRSTGRLL